MARIAGVDIPKDKQVKFSLQYVYGIGPKFANEILVASKIEPTTRVKDLTENELTLIRDYIATNFTVEGELARIVTGNIKRLKEIKAYRGIRHAANLPSRGQRTKTNARTRRGKKVTVGGTAKKVAAKT
jgi:small subunit ribosomal protein S13